MSGSLYLLSIMCHKKQADDDPEVCYPSTFPIFSNEELIFLIAPLRSDKSKKDSDQ